MVAGRTDPAALLTVFDETLAPAFVTTTVPTRPMGPAAPAARAAAACPDTRLTVQQLLGEDELVAVRLHGPATHTGALPSPDAARPGGVCGQSGPGRAAAGAAGVGRPARAVLSVGELRVRERGAQLPRSGGWSGHDRRLAGPLGEAAAVEREWQAFGRALPGHLDHADPIEAECAHGAAQAAPAHQVPVPFRADESGRLDLPRHGGVAVLVAIVQADHALLKQRVLHRPQPARPTAAAWRAAGGCGRAGRRRRCARSPTSPPPPCAGAVRAASSNGIGPLRASRAAHPDLGAAARSSSARAYRRSVRFIVAPGSRADVTAAPNPRGR